MGGTLETASVKAATIADARVSAGDGNVDTNNASKTVTLNSDVQTEARKRIAGELAFVQGIRLPDREHARGRP